MLVYIAACHSKKMVSILHLIERYQKLNLSRNGLIGSRRHQIWMRSITQSICGSSTYVMASKASKRVRGDEHIILIATTIEAVAAWPRAVLVASPLCARLEAW